jgi:hypothetical protein
LVKFLRLKIIKLFVADPNPGYGAFLIWIRDEKNRILDTYTVHPDPQHCLNLKNDMASSGAQFWVLK